jgi:hypothetical protein
LPENLGQYRKYTPRFSANLTGILTAQSAYRELCGVALMLTLKPGDGCFILAGKLRMQTLLTTALTDSLYSLSILYRLEEKPHITILQTSAFFN